MDMVAIHRLAIVGQVVASIPTMEATGVTGQIITVAMADIFQVIMVEMVDITLETMEEMVVTILETMEEMVGTILETMEEMEGISQVQTGGTVVTSQEITVETVDIGRDLHFHHLENHHKLIQLPSPKLCDK